METHPIENLMKSTMENLKDMIDVNTIVGDAVESKDGSLIIPISKVSFGFASGGSEFACSNTENSDSDYPFGGGSGAGVTVKPVAFLVISNGSVKLLSLDQKNTYEKLIDSVPQVMDFFKGICKDKHNNKCNKSEDNHTKDRTNETHYNSKDKDNREED